MGAREFRTLSLDDIAEEDLLTNADTGLGAKTQPAKLGSADAFVSHSWHDAGAAKYAALIQWAEKFRVLKRAPTLWLDKARHHRPNQGPCRMCSTAITCMHRLPL